MFMRCKVTVDTSHYPKEVPFEVPKGWVKCKLSDVCQFESGFAFKSESYKKKGVPLIRISNIQEGTITTDGGVCIQEVVESRFHIVKGDLLIALSGATTGKMGIYDKDDDALLNQRVGNLRIISKTCFLPEYRNLFMESQTATILEQAWGGAQPNISPNTIIGFDILLPPYAEQCRIVSKANELLAIVSHIESAQDQIETTADGIKTKILDLAIRGKLVPQDDSEESAINLLRRINPAFQPSDNLHYCSMPRGWCECRLQDCVEILNGYAFKSNEYTGEGIRVIRITNVQSGTISDEDPKFFPAQRSHEIDRYLLKEGDLLMSLTGNVGRVAFLEKSMLPAALNQRVACLRSPLPSEVLMFIFYFCQTKEFANACVSSGKGVAQLNISTEWLKDYRISLPPINEIRRIIKAVRKHLILLEEIANI